MEQPNMTSGTIKQDEISLRDAILSAQRWWKYLLSKWMIIVFFGIAGAALGLGFAFTKKPSYVGELTFILEEGQQSSLASYAGLASQFGFDLGGGGSSGLFSGENILEFLKSRLMVERTLLSPVSVDNKEMSLADLYISFNELNKNWEKIPELKNLQFHPGKKNRGDFSRMEDSILNTIQGDVVKDYLSITKPDKKLSFISVRCISTNETFSKEFIQRLVYEATDFYVRTKTKRSKANVDQLQFLADSIEAQLNKKTYSSAVAQDLNLNPARQVASVETEIKTRDKIVLQTMYGEVVKNLELSKMTMAQETPLVQVVDTPIYPLKKEKLGKLKGLIIGGFCGGILIVLYLILRMVYVDIMKKE